MKYKAIIFDLDGTLLNTIDDLADSMNTVLERMGFPTHPVDKHKHFVGNGISNLVQRTLPLEKQSDEMIKSCVAAMLEEYTMHLIEKTRPYSGVPELLNKLTALNIKMCILSNKPDSATKGIVGKLLPEWKFELVLGERQGIPRKPDPHAALEIADALNVKPENFLYLGDSGADMETADAAGMFPVGALWGFRDADELEKSGAKMLIKNPVELLELL